MQSCSWAVGRPAAAPLQARRGAACRPRADAASSFGGAAKQGSSSPGDRLRSEAVAAPQAPTAGGVKSWPIKAPLDILRSDGYSCSSETVERE